MQKCLKGFSWDFNFLFLLPESAIRVLALSTTDNKVPLDHSNIGFKKPVNGRKRTGVIHLQATSLAPTALMLLLDPYNYDLAHVHVVTVAWLESRLTGIAMRQGAIAAEKGNTGWGETESHLFNPYWYSRRVLPHDLVEKLRHRKVNGISGIQNWGLLEMVWFQSSLSLQLIMISLGGWPVPDTPLNLWRRLGI